MPFLLRGGALAWRRRDSAADTRSAPPLRVAAGECRKLAGEAPCLHSRKAVQMAAGAPQTLLAKHPIGELTVFRRRETRGIGRIRLVHEMLLMFGLRALGNLA